MYNYRGTAIVTQQVNEIMDKEDLDDFQKLH